MSDGKSAWTMLSHSKVALIAATTLLPFCALGVSIYALLQSNDAQDTQARIAKASLEPVFELGAPPSPYNLGVDDIAAFYNVGAPIVDLSVQSVAQIVVDKNVNGKPTEAVSFVDPSYFSQGTPENNLGTGLIYVATSPGATAHTQALFKEENAFNIGSQGPCITTYGATLTKIFGLSYQDRLGENRTQYFEINDVSALTQIPPSVGRQALGSLGGVPSKEYLDYVHTNWQGMFARWKARSGDSHAVAPAKYCPTIHPKPLHQLVVEHAGNTFTPQKRRVFTWSHPATYVTIDAITDDPNYGDERAFLTAAPPGAAKYFGSHALDVTSGEAVVLTAYYCNSAASNISGSTATGAKIRFELPSGPQSKAVVRAEISATNARPRVISDQVALRSSRPIRVRFISGSAQILNFAHHPGLLSDEIVTSGQLLGYSKMDGRLSADAHYGCGWVTIRVLVQ